MAGPVFNVAGPDSIESQRALMTETVGEESGLFIRDGGGGVRKGDALIPIDGVAIAAGVGTNSYWE